MRSRLFLLAAVCALLASGWFLASRRRDQRALEGTRAALRLHARAQACLFGDSSTPRDASLRAARLRRIALATPPGAPWPAACETHLRALRDASASSDALSSMTPAVDALVTAVRRELSPDAVRAFQHGERDLSVDGAARASLALHTEAAVRANARRVRLPEDHDAVTPAPLAPIGGDVLPLSLAPGALTIGSTFRAGTLNALFIEPSQERVFCRSRDRGASVACRRFAPAHAPHWLVAHDTPEALVLVDDGHPEHTVVVSPDATDAPIYTAPHPLVSSLPALVQEPVLHAVTDVAGASVWTRCTRGGACVDHPLMPAVRRESVIVSADRAVWWFGVNGPDGALSLDARSLDADDAPMQHLTPLRTSATLLASCLAEGVAWVAAVDARGAQLAMVTADAPPRVMQGVSPRTLPYELVCDAKGATLVDARGLQSCERDAGCSPSLPLTGVHRVARIDGTVVDVFLGAGDGLRVRAGAGASLGDAPVRALDDDASHGGLSARALWMLPAGDRLVLFATGATTAVLWSDDRGVRWHPAREAVSNDARPMRLGTLPR